MPPLEIPSIDTLIFDLGGVLIRWDPGFIIHSYSDKDDERDWVVTLLREFWPAWDAGRYQRAELIQRASAKLQLSEAKIADILAHILSTLTPLQEGVALLAKCRELGVPCYVLSNIPSEVLQHLQDENKWFRSFAGIVCSGTEKLAKPDPAIFQCLLSRYELAPERCLFLDDTVANIATARELGLLSLRYDTDDPLSTRSETLELLSHKEN